MASDSWEIRGGHGRFRAVDGLLAERAFIPRSCCVLVSCRGETSTSGTSSACSMARLRRYTDNRNWVEEPFCRLIWTFACWATRMNGMESSMVICRNWAVALAFALWSAIPSAAGAAMPGSGVQLPLQSVAEQSKLVVNAKHGSCGRRCVSGRGYNRGPQTRSRVQRGQTPRRYEQHRRRGTAAGPRDNGRSANRNRNGSRKVYRTRDRRNQVAHSSRRGKSVRSNSYRSGRSAHRNGRHRGKRSYRSYGHYKKHCRRYCGRHKHRRRHYGYYNSGWWYSWPWWSLSVPVYAYAQDSYQYDDPHVAYCLGKYRSYDPYTDTYVAYSGNVRRCRSPYSG